MKKTFASLIIFIICLFSIGTPFIKPANVQAQIPGATENDPQMQALVEKMKNDQAAKQQQADAQKKQEEQQTAAAQTNQTSDTNQSATTKYSWIIILYVSTIAALWIFMVMSIFCMSRWLVRK